MASRSSTISTRGLAWASRNSSTNKVSSANHITDLMIVRRLPQAAALQPVQGRLAGQHRTVGPLRRQALRQKPKNRVVAQPVLVVDASYPKAIAAMRCATSVRTLWTVQAAGRRQQSTPTSARTGQ